MKLLKAPNYYDDTEKKDKEHVIFLAGGISNCPNWQELLESHLKFAFGDKKFVIANPRRDDFDVTNKSATTQQIEWEHKMLERCDTLLFWFPEETLCPITLYELGAYTDKKKNLIVGVHERYKRRVDVEKQTALRRPGLYVAVGFNTFLEEVASHLRKL
jgi:sulfatase maturation enzyme AslB (radical SAM superfamily)